MNDNTPTKKKQLPILTYAVIFICGFLAGVGFTVLKTSSSGTGGGTVSSVAETNQKSTAINNLEATVTANPENFQAWIQLGNLYYDTGQYDKAITAYTTSLKYHSGDANLLTDLGVMYRRTHQPKKAIAMFEKAEKIDPTHQASLFNEGIVRYYDLGDTKGALACWQELLKINPDATAHNGQRIQDLVDQVKKGIKLQ